MRDRRYHKCPCCGKKYSWKRAAADFIGKCKRCMRKGK